MKDIGKKTVPIYADLKRKNKWLGILEYRSMIFIILYFFIVIYLLLHISIKTDIKIVIGTFLTIPVGILFYVNKDQESIIDMLVTISLFYYRRGIYLKKIEIKSLKNEYYQSKKKKRKSINDFRLKKKLPLRKNSGK